MERDEERPDAEVEEERGPEEPATQGEACTTCGVPLPPSAKFCAECGTTAARAEPAAQGRQEGPGGNVRTAVISAAGVVLGVALFAAGFLTHSLLDDDLDPVEEDLAVLTERVGEIQEVLGIAGGDGTAPTPAPVVAATADDDPFIGPEDASVTIIEFSDYQ
jgi:hypothetical protein